MAKKYSLNPHRKRFSFGKFFGIVCLALLVAGGALFGITQTSFESDLFRGEMISLVARKTGLEPYWDGPVALRFSAERGISLSVNNASLRNPAWASRKDMAKIGRIDFDLDPLSLLKGKISIKRFDLVNADILIETSASGESNLNVKQKDEVLPGDNVAQVYRYFSGGIGVVKIGVVNSNVAVRTPQGELFSAHADKLRLVATETKTKLTFDGAIEDIPLLLDASGEALDRLSDQAWLFSLDARLAQFRLRGTGRARDSFKTVDMRDLAIVAGKSALMADLTFSFAGERPFLGGRVTGKDIDVADIWPSDQKEKPYYFSRRPLPLTLVRRVDAKLDIGVSDVTYGLSTLQNVSGRFAASNGVLSVSPFQFTLGGSTATTQIKFDARGDQPGVAMLFQARKMDVSRLFALGGLESILTGRADIDAHLRAIGSSVHDLAAHADGTLSFVAAGGTVSGQAIAKVSSEALAAITPGLKAFSNSQMDCFAGKFYVKNGRAVTNGLVIDGENVAILGRGGFDLGEEKIDLAFKPYARGSDLSTLFPPMHVYGTFQKRQIDFDANETVEKALSLFTLGEVTDQMPVELSATEGARACAAARIDAARAPQSEAGQFVDGIFHRFMLRLKSFSDRNIPTFDKNLFSQ